MSKVLDNRVNAPWSHEFLSEILTNASWLQSPFNAPHFIADFGEGATLDVDFEVSVGGDGLLTDARHRNLFEDAQYFLLLQTHPCVRGRGHLSPATQRQRVIEGLYVLDHFLLNAKSTALARYGFSGIVSHQLKSMLVERATHPNVTEAIYCWTSHLTFFLKEKAKTVGLQEMTELKCHHLDVLNTDIPKSDWSLELSPSELSQARAWLFLNKLYAKAAVNLDYRQVPATVGLTELIYPDTLWGRNPSISKQIFEELCVSPKDKWQRECDGVSVKPGTLDDACARKTLESYRHTLCSFKHLARLGRGIPESSLTELATYDLGAALNLKDDCTFGIVPFDYVKTVARQAIEFYFAYSSTLFACCAKVIAAAKKANSTVQKFLARNPIEPYLTRKARKLGIRYWSLNFQMSFVESNPNQKETHHKSPSTFHVFETMKDFSNSFERFTVQCKL